MATQKCLVQVRQFMVCLVILYCLVATSSQSSTNGITGNPQNNLLHRNTRQVIFPDSHLRQVSSIKRNPRVLSSSFPKKQVSSFLPKTSSLLPSECGQAHSTFKITNGETAGFGEFPWIAFLGYRSRSTRGYAWKCAATLINDRYVVTAAHCLHRSSNSDQLSVVRLGEHDLTTKVDCFFARFSKSYCAPPPEDYFPEKQILHPQYDPVRVINDIALIRLHRPVRFSAFIQPICLPNPIHEARTFPWAIVAGWGKTELNVLSNTLMKATLPFVDSTTCSRKLEHLVHNTQICYGGLGGRDSCDGDSGGPLIVPHKGRGPPFYLIGVVSYGRIDCGKPGVPGVYTNVGKYKSWIVSQLHK